MLRSKVSFDPSPSASAREIIPPSFKRVSLTLFPPATGRVTLLNDPTVTDGNGLVLAAGQAPVTLWLRYHGECVQQGWTGIYTAGATALAWIDGLG